jgi:hypothetical protein
MRENTMSKSLIDDSKLYELFLKDKQHKEDMRDQINAYYISLLTAVVGLVPFIDRIYHEADAIEKGHVVRLFLIAISLVGLVLACTWRLNIRRILCYLEFVDEQIEILEIRNNIHFISYIKSQKTVNKWPNRVTKYQLILPLTFIVIFIITILYSLTWLVF